MLFLPLLAVFTLALTATSAWAGQVTATFDDVNPGLVVTINSAVLGGSATGWAGDYNFKNASGDLTGSFTGFCIDIAQEIWTGLTTTFNVGALSSAPTPGQAMGTYRASLIAELWQNDFAAIGSDNVKAAAFQVAIWKIINETNLDTNHNMTLDVTTGAFQMTGADTGTHYTLIAAQANAWLSASQLDRTGNGAQATNLKALLSTQYQDYVTAFPQGSGPGPAVPAPPGSVLAGIGTGCLFLGSLWQKQRARKAAALLRIP